MENGRLLAEVVQEAVVWVASVVKVVGEDAIGLPLRVQPIDRLHKTEGGRANLCLGDLSIHFGLATSVC